MRLARVWAQEILTEALSQPWTLEQAAILEETAGSVSVLDAVKANEADVLSGAAAARCVNEGKEPSPPLVRAAPLGLACEYDHPKKPYFVPYDAEVFTYALWALHSDGVHGCCRPSMLSHLPFC